MDIKALVVSMVMFVIFPAWARSEDSAPGVAMGLRGNPAIVEKTRSYEAYVGESVMMDCAVDDVGQHTVIWRKTDGNTLTVGHESFFEDGRIVSKHIPQEQKWNLVIKRVRMSDQGMYECQISSRLRHLRHFVSLTVREREVQKSPSHNKSDIKLTGDEYVERGGRLYLVCNATGKEHPPDDLDWFRDGNKLPESDDGREIIRKDVSLTSRTIISTLEIQKARPTDTGNYVCRTSNMLIQNLMVTVLNGEPSPSVNKRGTPGERENSESRKSDRQTGCTGANGEPCESPTYRRANKAGDEESGASSTYSTSYFSVFLINLLVIGVSHIYWIFPS